jgi:TatD DNase family protein
MSSEQPNQTPASVYAYALRENLYLNLTNRCTNRCAFCPKFDKQWEVRGYELRLRDEPTAAQLIDAVGDPAQYEEIVFCGLGEPTLRLDVLFEVADALHGRGARLRLNTDGLAGLVHGRDVTPELSGRIDALSVSLNAQDESTYDRHCRPGAKGAYPALLRFVARARAHVPDITVTAIDGLEGVDVEACEKIARELGVKFRRRVLDEVG